MKKATSVGRPIAATVLSVILCGCTSSPEPPSVTPSPAVMDSTVRIVGEEETIYDWTSDRCADDMLPDLPVRALRDTQGRIELNLSFTRNFRLVGSDFDSLEPNCQVTLASAVDPDPSHYRFKEWVGSTYTTDGQTIYALIHNEWYGEEASRWNASRDFSSEQGIAGWLYQSYIGKTYVDMEYNAGHGRWQGSASLCQIGRDWAHPDIGCDTTRTWVSPVDATVNVSGTVGDTDPGGGDGVTVSILKGAQVIWSSIIENGDPQGKQFNLDVPVRLGDTIRFRVSARGDPGWDTTRINPAINIGPAPCPSGVHENCLMMSITAAVSTDAGRTYARPAAPYHLVAALPYQWTPDAGHIAMWQPSNIVRNPQDGFYYALVQLDLHRRGESGFQGMCVMRTQTLSDAKSWRAWDGNGFNLRFADPYVDDIASPEHDTCTAVSQETVGALSYSLTYNSYLNQFIAAGVDVFKNPPGFYYALSRDLIHWSPKRLLKAAPLYQTNNGATPYFAYPSLVDHGSPGRSFDVTGKSPYLYYTRVNSLNPLDFDLLRVRIEFGT